MVAGALAATGEKTSEVRKGGKSSYDALLKLSITCDIGPDGGAFAYQPDKKGALAANADATAAGVLGVLGKGFVTTAGKTSAPPTCDSATAGTPSGLARNGAAHLAAAVLGAGYLKSALPGAEDQPDYGNTADAVVALAAQGATEQAKKPSPGSSRTPRPGRSRAGPPPTPS